MDLLDTFVERLLGSEYSDIGLHDLLHLETDLGGRLGALRCADLVENSDGIGTGIGSDGVSCLTRAEVVADGVRNGTAEDDEIQERVSTEAVGTVNGDGSGFTAGEKSRHNLIVARIVLCNDLTSVLGGNTTHVVMDCRQDGDGLLSNVDTSENGSSLGDTRQTLMEDLSGQMAELEVDMILVGANTTSLADFKGHGTGDNIAGGKILGSWRITLHKSLTLGVQEVTSLTTGALGDQTSSAVDTSGVELDELEILVRQTGTGNHGHAVTSTGMGRRAAKVGTSVSSSGQDGVLCDESVDSSVFLVVGNDTLANTVLHDQVSGEVLNEVLCVVSQRLSVKSVEKSMASTVSSGTASVCLATLAELLRLSSESTLVTTPYQYTNRSFFEAETYILPSSVLENGQP